jgi:hypothetical protein
MEKFCVFSHPARILHQDREVVTVAINVDGKEILLNVPSDRFDFKITEGKRIMVDGILSGGEKSLEFRKIKPLTLDAKHEAMLVDILASFKRI